ncbi:GNAT family N-acetyltransferase [Chloroflexota bacterium]
MLGNKLLLGEKVLLNAVTKEDLPQYAEWFANLDLLILLREGGVFPFTLQDEEEWFEQQRKSEDVTFAIRTRQDQTLIGSCGLMEPNWQARHAELGIAIGAPDYWGQGYGSDAVCVLLRYGFLEFNLNRIYLQVYDYNTRGIAAYHKVGFVEEGRLRQQMFRDGQYHDIVWMSILRAEWADS